PHVAGLPRMHPDAARTRRRGDAMDRACRHWHLVSVRRQPVISYPRLRGSVAPMRFDPMVAGRRSSKLDELHRTARQFWVDGILWLAYELPASQFDRRATASLVFETDAVMRRIRNYPANWRELHDKDLVALSWKV